jgi:hypothetical protein
MPTPQTCKMVLVASLITDVAHGSIPSEITASALTNLLCAHTAPGVEAFFRTPKREEPPEGGSPSDHMIG